MLRWLWVMVALGVTASCGTTSSDKRSKLGESCQERTDCASGLACTGGVCTERKFDVEQSGKECVVVACHEDADCCGNLCRSYRDACQRGDADACASADAACDCGASCQDGACTETCSDTRPCAGGRPCVGSRCVECACDAHCGTGGTCKDGSCMPACADDADCGTTISATGDRVLTKCTDGACVETGCTTDRECVALKGDTRAVCDAGTCRMPCKSDIECDNPESFDFTACVGGVCRSLGCETTQECRALVERYGDQGTDVVCMEFRAPAPLAPGVGGEVCPVPVTCGDGLIDPGEECDGSYFGGETCASYTLGALPGGTLTCTDACIVTTTQCTSTPTFCGDGFIDAGEQCDGTNLDGETCASYTMGALPGGALTCTSTCNVSFALCTGGTGFCGDGFVDAGEQCDGTNFDGETCLTATLAVRPYGTLSCLGCALSTVACASSPGGICGDGVVDVGEDCDGVNLAGETCASATFGALPNGTLFCSACGFDTTACSSGSWVCGDGFIDAGEQCDGTSFAGETCSTWTAGTRPLGVLSCLGCTIDESSCTAGSCTDACIWANDGWCDEPSLCSPGTDCTDCTQ